MRLTWRQRLAAEPSLRDIARWPLLPVDTVPRARRRAYLRNLRIVARALAGDTTFAALAKTYGLSQGRISQLLDRCLGGESDAPPALMAGLVPYRVLAVKTRGQPLDTLEDPRGYSGAFEALLAQVQGLREALDRLIGAKLRDAPQAQRLTPLALHGELKRVLAEQHWPRDTYPYTTADCGYESVRRYLHRRQAELAQARQLKQNARVLAPRPRGERPLALRAIQIDEHLLDLHSTLHLIFDQEPVPLRLARMTVALAVDVGSTCVLGYQLIPSQAANTDDMLALIDQCVIPRPMPPVTTAGLRYAPGAYFPSALPDATPIPFGRVYLDNAWIHRAGPLVELLCERMGASCNWGLPRVPQLRSLVESLFHYVERHCGHRVASTTGSHPADPIRESRKNHKRPPRITFQALEEALGVLLSEHNVTPSARLGGLTPLERYQRDGEEHYVPSVPTVVSRQWRPFHTRQTVALHWIRKERRLPHVNFLYARYSGPGLLAAAGRGEKKIAISFDRRDIRTLQATTLDGQTLGELTVQQPWRRFAHSVATRRVVHRFAASNRRHARDPLAGYLSHLLTQRETPSGALSLLRLYRESAGAHDAPLPIQAANDGAPESTNASAPRERFHWLPSVAEQEPRP